MGLLRHNVHPNAIQFVAIDINVADAKGVGDKSLQRSGGVLQISPHPKFFGGERLGREGREECRQGEADRLERIRWIWLKNRVQRTEKEAQNWGAMVMVPCVTALALEE